jgi:antitoxin VapB
MNRKQEFELKMERIGAYCEAKGLDGVALSRVENVAWLGCGADSAVNTASETGVATLVARGGRCVLVTNNIEAERLKEEELAGVPIADVAVHNWWEPAEAATLAGKLAEGGEVASDTGLGGLAQLGGDFARLRWELTAAEVERYRALGADASAAIENTLGVLVRGMRESDIAGAFALECMKKGIHPLVLLVACDERLPRWRHPIYKEAALDRAAMIVLCGRRRGLVAALTRMVSVGESDEELLRRHEAVCFVDATMMVSTRVGRPAVEVLEAAKRAYAERGFADEWQLHHQGGAIGYCTRDYVAVPGLEAVVASPQAFAWNPSITGTKSEDTILVTEGEPEVLTACSEGFPSLEFDIEGVRVVRAGVATIEA